MGAILKKMAIFSKGNALCPVENPSIKVFPIINSFIKGFPFIKGKHSADILKIINAQRISFTENGHFLQDRPHPFIKENSFIKGFIIGNSLIKRFPFVKGKHSPIFYRAQRISSSENCHFLQDRPHRSFAIKNR